MRRLILPLVAALTAILHGGMAPAGGVGVVYVDPDAIGPSYDGTSWCQAYTDLQDALSAAWSSGGAIGEIRVADGTYTPAEPGGDPIAAFELVNGAVLLGGFAGCGARSPDARNVGVYETILSGDLNADDGPDFTNTSDNSYNVLVGSGTWPDTVVDGFTISGGYADVDPFDNGGGMVNDNGSPTVRDCTFAGNFAGSDGGGMYNVNFSDPTLVNVTFLGNVADNGGGMYNRNGSSPLLVNCRFIGNEGSRSAGGLRNQDFSNPELQNCLFSGNFTTTGPANGGAVYNYTSSPDLFNCTLVGNETVYRGGGIYNTNSSGPELNGCILWDNWAGTEGDEIVLKSSSSTSVRYCIVAGGQSGAVVDTGCTLIWDSMTNLTEDPLFRDADGADDWAGTMDDDARVQSLSPALDAGDPAAPFDDCGETELDNMPRVLCGRVDIGAYEYGAGDFNCDRQVDLVDFGAFGDCVSDAGGDGCEAFYFDGANCVVDLFDFGRFQIAFGGP